MEPCRKACSICFILSLILSEGVWAEPMKSDVGNYFPFIDQLADESPLELSYLAKDWPNVEDWRALGKARMKELLAYDPAPVPPNPVVLEEVQKEGFTRKLIRFSVDPYRTAEAYLLIPDSVTDSSLHPAVLVLHDHSGFYYSGKEKMVDTGNPPEPLAEQIEGTYEGRTLGDELARRGFIVFVPDCFYFGSQRIDPTQLSDRYAEKLDGLKPGSPEYIRTFNDLASQMEAVTCKTILTSGTTWSGIMLHDDTASLDYLLSIPGVDPNRIGCIGLSLGGFRSAYLFGLDGRIRVGVIAGWMTTYRDLLFDHLRFHTWMLYIPRQYKFLDLPDVVSLNGPNPVMVINCLQDNLFTVDGMKNAEEKIRKAYSKMGADEDRVSCRYYDVPHSLNIKMQNDGIAWLERWLKD